VASIATASSTGSKTSMNRGGYRKLQGFFGEEFPGRDSSDNSLPASANFRDQHSRSYSHSQQSQRGRKTSNATSTSQTREGSPTSSRPRSPVPAPEVVPFLYQDNTVSTIIDSYTCTTWAQMRLAAKLQPPRGHSNSALLYFRPCPSSVDLCSAYLHANPSTRPVAVTSARPPCPSRHDPMNINYTPLVLATAPHDPLASRSSSAPFLPNGLTRCFCTFAGHCSVWRGACAKQPGRPRSRSLHDAGSRPVSESAQDILLSTLWAFHCPPPWPPPPTQSEQ
jgi:hypothetical protein